MNRKGNSMSSRPIVQIIGVEGHFLTAAALGQVFARPVVGIFLKQEMEALRPAYPDTEFLRTYSFPDFYKKHESELNAMSWDEIDRRQRDLENTMGIETSALLASFDRDFKRIGEFDRMRRIQLLFLSFARKILDLESPAFVLNGTSLYFQVVMRRACRKFGIPFLHTMVVRGNHRIAFFDPKGQQIGMQRVFGQIAAGRHCPDLSTETAAAADSLLDSFLAKPERPFYADINDRTSLRASVVVRSIGRELRLRRFFSYFYSPVDRAIRYQNLPLEYLKEGLISRTRAMIHRRIRLFEIKPDLDRPFLYLPLHFSPEITDMVFGTLYDHHEGFVFQLAKRIPSDTMLYVKEHTSMLGRRSGSFYRRLNRLYNVRMIDPRVDTFRLIRSARAVITVTGTAGWEAFLLQKPVVALGDVFYNFLPGVLHCPLDDRFPERFAAYLNDFHPDPDLCRSAYRAYYATSWPARQGDIGTGGDTPPKEARRNAPAFALAFQDFIQRFGDEVEGVFPESMHPVVTGEKTAGPEGALSEPQ